MAPHQIYSPRSIHADLDHNELVFILDYINSKYPMAYSSAMTHLNAYLEYIARKSAMWIIKHDGFIDLESDDSDTENGIYDSPTPYRPPRDLTRQVDDLTL